MVFKWLSGLLVLGVAAVVIGSTFSSSSSPAAPVRKPATGPCVEDRSGRSCESRPIVESPAFAFSPDGKNAYLMMPDQPGAPADENGISIYDRDPATGSIVQKPGTAGCIVVGKVKGCQPGRAVRNGAQGIVLSPDGRNVYAATEAGLAVFDRDPLSGTLTQKAGGEGCFTSLRQQFPTCTPVGGLHGAGGVAVSPDGKNVYVTGKSPLVFDRDPTTGALTQQPGSADMIPGGSRNGVVVSPDGRDVYIFPFNAIFAFNRDSDTGALTRVPKPAGCISEKAEGGCRRGHELSIYSLAISPDGRNLYGVGEVEPKVSVLAILDRLPDGTLVQEPGRAGCIGGEDGKRCAHPFRGAGGSRGISVSRDGRRVYTFQYPQFPGEGVPFIRHPSGRLTEARGD